VSLQQWRWHFLAECFGPRRVLLSFHWQGTHGSFDVALFGASMVEGSCRAARIGDGDHLGRVVVPQCFRPPWGRAVKTGSASVVMCSFLAWTSLAVDVMVAKGLGDGGYRCACFRSRLCLRLHVSSTPHRLGHSDMFRWCLELVLYFLSLSYGGGRRVCTNLSSILI
jgi:hypothetical protein